MTKDEIKLHELLQECIEEQKKIGLTPKENTEIYLSMDPKTKERPRKRTAAFAMIDDDGRPFIVITKIHFKVYPIWYVKSIIHHELIHLNSSDNKLIRHRRDWEKYTELANKIYEAYGVNPLITYDDKCFKTKESLPEYNCIGECPRCGAKNYYVLREGVEYNPDIWCHNCGVKYIMKILDK